MARAGTHSSQTLSWGLEGAGLELSVPRYPWSRGLCMRSGQSGSTSDSVLPHRRPDLGGGSLSRFSGLGSISPSPDGILGDPRSAQASLKAFPSRKWGPRESSRQRRRLSACCAVGTEHHRERDDSARRVQGRQNLARVERTLATTGPTPMMTRRTKYPTRGRVKRVRRRSIQRPEQVIAQFRLPSGRVAMLVLAVATRPLSTCCCSPAPPGPLSSPEMPTLTTWTYAVWFDDISRSRREARRHSD
jgi:hypothetical protein